jgi:hypothetical protein
VAIIRDKRGKMRLVSHGREVREEGRYTLWKPTERKEHAESIRYKYTGYVVFVLYIIEGGRIM